MCMFNDDPRPICAVAAKCAGFADVLAMMKDEQRSIMGASAPDNQIFDLLCDFGIIDMCCEDFQSQVGGY